MVRNLQLEADHGTSSDPGSVTALDFPIHRSISMGERKEVTALSTLFFWHLGSDGSSSMAALACQW